MIDNTNNSGGGIGTPETPSEQTNQEIKPEVQEPTVTLTQAKLDEIINGKFAQGAKNAEKKFKEDSEYQNFLSNKESFNKFLENQNKNENRSVEEITDQINAQWQEKYDKRGNLIGNYSNEIKKAQILKILTDSGVRVEKNSDGTIKNDYREMVYNNLKNNLEFNLESKQMNVKDEKDLISSPKEYIDKYLQKNSLFLNPTFSKGLQKDVKNTNNNAVGQLEKGSKKAILESIKNKFN